MRKRIVVGVAVVFAALAGAAQAAPLSATGALASSRALEQSLPEQGVTKVWYHPRRHYGWYRGHHYGWRHHYGWHRHYAWYGGRHY
jgi:hypothetical protein